MSQLSSEWVMRSIRDSKGQKWNVFVNKNSGLTCYDEENLTSSNMSEKSQLTVLGVWNNKKWLPNLPLSKKAASQAVGMKGDCSLAEDEKEYVHIEKRDPYEVTWNPDFILSCPDRNILVSKKCLMFSSKVFKAAFEDDKESKSIDLDWRSNGIIRVMEIIHILPKNKPYTIDISMDLYEQDMFSFCFRYEIEPVFSMMRKRIGELIPTTENSMKWLWFFHQFQNADKTKIFEKEIDAIRSYIADSKKVEDYIALYSDPIMSNFTYSERQEDDRAIMRKMEKNSSKSGKLIVNENFSLGFHESPVWVLYEIIDNEDEKLSTFIDVTSSLVVYNHYNLTASVLGDIKNVTAYGIWDNDSQSTMELSSSARNYAKSLGIRHVEHE